MSKLFQLPQASSPRPEPTRDDVRERDDAVARVAVSTPSLAERDEEAHYAARDFAARTTTIRRAGYTRGVKWGLCAALATIAFGPAGGIAVVAIAELVK